jgi:hypothetical protein
MKNTWKKIVVVLALVGATSLVSARAAVSVYAQETETSSNAVVATAEAPAETNAPATTTHRDKKFSSDADHPPVRIDETGVHVGGPHPVDIDVPSHASHRGDEELDVVGIVGVVFGCAVPVAIVGIIVYFRHRRLKMQHETMRAMIEKGIPIPPELLARPNQDNPSQDRPYRARNDLRGGLILVGGGAGLLMIAGKVGWILVFIGAARLVVWLIEDRKN